MEFLKINFVFYNQKKKYRNQTFHFGGAVRKYGYESTIH
jgi:hypothetical protein